MEKEEKIYEMMVELGQLLGQMTRENTQLLEFVREKIFFRRLRNIRREMMPHVCRKGIKGKCERYRKAQA